MRFLRAFCCAFTFLVLSFSAGSVRPQEKTSNSLLLVLNKNEANLAIIDAATMKVLGKVPVGDSPHEVVISADGKRAYVALGPANRVAVVNGETYEVEKYLLVGQRVWQLAFTPDEKLLFTTNGASNDVSVIDTERQRVTKSVGVGRFPWGVAVAP